ncbi:MAG: glycosyl hydrolase family 28 protein, partial [Verrucomicrobiota bacterium]
LQGLIDELAATGGGTLVFPAGRFLTGGLILRDGIHLHLEMGSVLLGSCDLDDYLLLDPPPVRFFEDSEGVRALLLASRCRDLVVSGPGAIDGQGSEFASYRDVRCGRPRLIFFSECEDVRIEGVRLRNSAFWVQHYLHCRRLTLRDLVVFSHASCNNDGLDIDGCQDVTVSGCVIDSHDDAICLKANNNAPTENVVISNCITRTHCNHLKTGTESNGGFRNIVVSNLQMLPSAVREADGVTQGADYRGACGIALGCVDGGSIENVMISNVQMDQVRVPMFIRLGNRARPVNGSELRQPVGRASAIRLSNIVARDAGPCGGHIMGLPQSPLRDIRIENCEFHFEATAEAGPADMPVPLNESAYPAADAFGGFPAYGFFIRDVEDLLLANVAFRSGPAESRPALRWERSRGVRLDAVEDRRTKNPHSGPCLSITAC